MPRLGLPVPRPRAFVDHVERMSARLALKAALDALAPTGVRVGHRFIAVGDDSALLPVERAPLARSVPSVLRQSGAARIVARSLLAADGLGAAALPRSASGAPSWPPGIVGSLAHDDDVAVAAVASHRTFAILGIDIEPAMPLPEGLVPLVATRREAGRYARDLLESRLLFVIKEAVFKALNPLDGLFLDFQDIEVDLDAAAARTATGQTIDVAFAVRPRVVALCWRRAPGA